jgi:hypothetical protein
MIEIHELDERYRAWANEFLAAEWGTTRMVARGRVYDLSTMSGFVALVDGEPVIGTKRWLRPRRKTSGS